jgi:hypothetical protein
MSFPPRIPGSFGSHVVSVAANARDGLRAAHYFVQELATADDPAGQGGSPWKRPTWLLPADAPASLITGFIAQNARIADKVMNWSSGAASTLLAPALVGPDWRALPSPFNRDMIREIAASVGGGRFTANALFNAYFHRAAVHILRRCGKPPFLVLENRIDAARRVLASAERPDASDLAFLARALVALVRAAPVVEAGTIDPKSALAKTRDPNVAVAAVAVIALLFGEQGKPTDATDEDAFFAIVGALIAPRLAAIEQLVLRDDMRRLEAELAAIKSLY